VLEQRLRANDDDQRTLGAIGLAYMDDKRVLQPLIKGLSIGDWWAQAAVAITLGVLGDPAAIPALIESLPNTNTAGTNLSTTI
jgi:HEAT repeat protein